ncbi:hypothetical protein E2C01_074473 [Portunus trituberculatus]|uniref:Uncharacterized protein n=1 Tax=Portunus trituberculatus TaxID=210409 RepID=A0A5B7ID91_PORTR|nr:hypothetical protein [Portunus trituberculatus]
MSYFNIQEPKPEHFKPPSHHETTHRPPPFSYDSISHHARPRPHPRPRPTPPSYKPPPPATYTPPRPTYRPRPAAHYKPPTTTEPPSSYHRPAPRPKPSYGTHHKNTPTTTAKPHYHPTQATHKPPKAQKPILAPLLVPVDLHSIVIPKGVSFIHRKPRPPSPFHIPFFFRSDRKQRLQVPESVKSRLDSDQPEWVADLEPDRR